MSGNEEDEAVFCCFFYFMLFGRINGNTFRQLVKFGLLIAKTSSIYLNVRLKALDSVILF
jgi:hypothetical protein